MKIIFSIQHENNFDTLKQLKNKRNCSVLQISTYFFFSFKLNFLVIFDLLYKRRTGGSVQFLYLPITLNNLWVSITFIRLQFHTFQTRAKALTVYISSNIIYFFTTLTPHSNFHPLNTAIANLVSWFRFVGKYK